MVPVIYDLTACTDKPHHMVLYNISYYMDEWGANYCSAEVMLLKEMKSASKVNLLAKICFRSVLFCKLLSNFRGWVCGRANAVRWSVRGLPV